jgi:uncharacterized SAM-binding protein YcdF (DUF218 family)
MLVFGFSPASTWLLHALETRFPLYAAEASRPVDGIVLLGGAIQQDPTIALGQPVVNEAGDRLLAAAALARIDPDVPIVLSGGNAHLVGATRHTEARGMAEALAALGVAPERLVLEERSKNTWQNALQSREIAEPQPGETWLLVTSAWHMPRAMGTFRQAGFDVVPYPVDYRTMGSGDLARGFATQSDGLRRLDVAVREAIGVQQINLLGVSYGTRVAQQYMRRYPERTRRVFGVDVEHRELEIGGSIGVQHLRQQCTRKSLAPPLTHGADEPDVSAARALTLPVVLVDLGDHEPDHLAINERHAAEVRSKARKALHRLPLLALHRLAAPVVGEGGVFCLTHRFTAFG